MYEKALFAMWPYRQRYNALYSNLRRTNRYEASLGPFAPLYVAESLTHVCMTSGTLLKKLGKNMENFYTCAVCVHIFVFEKIFKNVHRYPKSPNIAYGNSMMI